MAFRALAARSGLLRGVAALSTTTACVDARQGRCVGGFDADRVFHPDEALPVHQLVDAPASPRTEHRQIGHILERLGAQADAALSVDPRGYPYSAQASVLIARNEVLERQIDALTRDVTRDEREALPELVAAQRPVAPPAPTRLTHHAESDMDRALAARAAAEEAYMTSSADSGLALYARQRNARIAGNQAHLAALGLDDGLLGGNARAVRARPNYSETRPRAVLSEEERAERERKREEKLAAREAKLAAAAERAAAKVEAAKRKDATLAKFAADSALAESNGASPPDMSLLPGGFRGLHAKAFRVDFLKYTVERYPGRKANNRDEYVIEVDPDTKVALDGKRPATKLDALHLLDQAYADAGTKGGNVFQKAFLRNGLWAAVLYKDRMLNGGNGGRAVVAYYKPWLPPWQRS